MDINYFQYVDNFSKYKNIKSRIILEGKKEKPKVTIAIPTYKRNHLIKKAIDSIVNQIEFDDYEILIVDNDFNNTELENILKGYKNDKISYYKNDKNIGLYGNWNRCIELAKGKYFIMLHDDDWLKENFFKTTIKYLEKDKAIYSYRIIKDFRKNKSTFSVKSLLKIFYKKIRKIKKTRELKIEDFFIANRGTDGIIFNKNAMVLLGGYNETFYPVSDYHFNIFYCLKYGSLQVKEELFYYRIEENESLKKETAIAFLEGDRKLRENLSKYYLDQNYFNKIEVLEEMGKKNLAFLGINLKYDKKIILRKAMILKLKDLLRECFL